MVRGRIVRELIESCESSLLSLPSVLVLSLPPPHSVCFSLSLSIYLTLPLPLPFPLPLPGSLTNLAKYPASTVQILGAEKALFRALKTKVLYI